MFASVPQPWEEPWGGHPFPGAPARGVGGDAAGTRSLYLKAGVLSRQCWMGDSSGRGARPAGAVTGTPAWMLAGARTSFQMQ